MKHILRMVLVFAALSMAVVSCQQDEDQDTTGAALLGQNSQLTRDLSALTQNKTETDDVLDSTSCYSVQLPVQVLVNGSQMTVGDADGYQTVETALESAGSSASVEFVYPITVLDSAYTAVNISSSQAFEGLIQGCQTPQSISCLTLNYPVSLSVYQTGSQTPSTVTVNSDQQFFLFLLGLQSGSVYEISYPVSAVNADGNTIDINSNDEFSTAIATAVSDCDCTNPGIMTSGLIMYIPFAGETQDLTGFAQPAINGNITYVTDRSGNPTGAISFLDGTSANRVNVPGNANNDLAQDQAFTISLWFDRQDNDPDAFEELINTADLSIMLGNQNNAAIHGPFVVGQQLAETLYDNDWISTGMTDEIGNWHHIALTYDGEILLLYRDGVIRNAAVASFSSMPGADFGANFKGFLDDIRIYKHALTQQEIQTLFNLEGDVNQCLD